MQILYTKNRTYQGETMKPNLPKIILDHIPKHTSISMEELLRRMEPQMQALNLGETEIKYALLPLIGSGKVELTPERKLRAIV